MWMEDWSDVYVAVFRLIFFSFHSWKTYLNVQKILNAAFCYSTRQFPGAEGGIKQFISENKYIQKAACFDSDHLRIYHHGTFYNQKKEEKSVLLIVLYYNVTVIRNSEHTRSNLNLIS